VLKFAFRNFNENVIAVSIVEPILWLELIV